MLVLLAMKYVIATGGCLLSMSMKQARATDIIICEDKFQMAGKLKVRNEQ